LRRKVYEQALRSVRLWKLPVDERPDGRLAGLSSSSSSDLLARVNW
jgi:hypothetical protein